MAPQATIGACSDEAYSYYMGNKAHQIFEYSISAKWLKEYLNENDIFVEWADSISFSIFEDGSITMSKATIIVDVYDVKTICAKHSDKITFDDLIHEYSNHLKAL